jgi:uncharacterized membrane protein YfcA
MSAGIVCAGALTGVLVGLTGVGGGSLMTPLLLLCFGVVPQTAVGTDLWFAALTKLTASRVHHGHGLIEWQVARRLWMGSLPSAALVALAMHWFGFGHATSRLLTLSIGVALALATLGIVFQERLHRLGSGLRIGSSRSFLAWQAPLTVLAGAVLGVLVTLTSIGAGAIGTVFLAFLYPLRLTPPRLIATDIVHAIPLALFAGVAHWLLGDVEGLLLLQLLLGSIPGVLAGSMLSARAPHRLLRHALALVLLLVTLKLFLGLR